MLNRTKRSRATPRLVLLAAASLAVGTAQSATFTVINTNDSGAGSLRQALTSANQTVAADIIAFAIPGPGPHTIALLTALQTVTQPVTIDGYTQPDALANTLVEGDDAVILINLDGDGLPIASRGLAVCASFTTIRGLSVTRFPQQAILIGADADGADCAGIATSAVVEGNFVGLLPDGVTAAGNDRGVFASGASGLRIGGAALAARNLLSSNAGGVSLNSSSGGAIVDGNYVGTDRSGTLDRGNSSFGVFVGNGATDATVGAAAPNRIAFNGTGMRIATGRATVFANEFFANDGLGIDLVAATDPPNDVTPNDPNDIDTGPNDLQNFPVITSATRFATAVSVNGTLDRPAGMVSMTYGIAVYASSSCDASGNGEGERFLGTRNVVLPSGTMESFIVTFVGEPLPVGTIITATATDAGGNTSEFSACATLAEDPAALRVSKIADTNDGVCNVDCSLREAMTAANANADANIIAFNIAGAGPHTIAPTSALPNITAPVLIDGYTQPGSAVNTALVGSNAVIAIRVNGVSAGNFAGFSACSSDVTLRGLSITRFVFHGIAMGQQPTPQNCTTGPYTGGVVVGNFVGLSPSGVAEGNTGSGILVSIYTARIGGAAPADRNVVSSNVSNGIQVINGASTQIDGNLIGTDTTGSLDRGNAAAGIGFGATGSAPNSVGGLAPNGIRFNREGALVGGGFSAVQLANNDFSANDNLGIDLAASGNGADGVTPNDANDADTGGNALQNFPVLTRAANRNGTLEVTGSLDVPVTANNAVLRIGLYESAACDASGNGEGAIFLGSVQVELSGNSEGFTVTLPNSPAIGAIVTSTATDPNGNTSEFSACSTVTDGDFVFANGFEP